MFKVISNSRVRVLLAALALFLLSSMAFARPGVTYFVTNTNDSGPDSLRQAILDTNGDSFGGTINIVFALPGSGPWTINVSSPLPRITHAMAMNGSGMVTIEGPGSGDGLSLTSYANVSGLSVRGFSTGVHIEGSYVQFSNCVVSGNGVGITMMNADHANIWACKIGTDATGDAVDENMVGIQVFGGTDNNIGATSAPNLISGNRTGGVYVSSSDNLTFTGNWMGTNLAGNASLMNPYNDEAPGVPDPDTNVFGFKAVGCTHLSVGGTGGSASNIITGFQKDIHLDGVFDGQVMNNRLGLKSDGTAPIPTPNGTDALDAHGIQMENGGNIFMHNCTYVEVGDGGSSGEPIPGFPGHYYPGNANVLANSGSYAVEMDSCTSCVLVGNMLGTTADGFTLAGGRGRAMVFLHDGSGNRVGPGPKVNTWSGPGQAYPNYVCASGTSTDMLAISHEAELQILDTLGYSVLGQPLGHCHVYLNVGGSSTTGDQSLGIHLTVNGTWIVTDDSNITMPIPGTIVNCDRPICVSDLAEPQGLGDTHNPFGSYDPTWSNERISWPALDSATSSGIGGHYQLPAGRAVTFHFYTSPTPGTFVHIGSYSLSGAANTGSGSFTAPIPISIGQTVYTATVDEFGSSSEFSDPITGAAANHSPTASAGSDQNVTVPHDGSPATNTASVSLDASGSSDPDAGQSLTYEWKDETNAIVGSAAHVNLDLSAGSHTFTVTVTDPFGAQASSTTHVTVAAEANSGPTVNGGVDASVLSGSAFVRTATYGDLENDAVQVAWYEGATLLSSTEALNVTLPVGSHTLTVTATDSYGATTSDTVLVTVRVDYGWHGFDQPINNNGSSIFKLGSTVPVKFSLTNGTPVAHLYLAKITNSVIGTEMEAASTSAADSGNTFRYTDTGYIFNLSTKGLTVGTWQLRVDLGDGDNTHWVLISIK